MPLIIVFLLMFLSACSDDKPRYNGYIDADLTYLSSTYPGRLALLAVKRGEEVKKNQLLFKVEQINDNLAVRISALAQKNLLEQRNQLIHKLHYENLNHKRLVKMRHDDAASQNDLDLSTTNLAVLKNQLAGIQAQIKSSILATADKKWERSQKVGYSFQKAIVFDTYFTKNEFVQSGQPILSLLENENIKVVFFIPEKKLSSTSLNSKIKLFSANKQIASGTISYVSKIAQYTPPIIYSREESENLVFRVEARIDNPNLNQIHLGQPVSLEIAS